MFKIGDFSRFSRVSVKMLRHYDELGLLPPAWVDPATNYRYYSADQLPRLNRIIALKDLGFTLEQVADLLADDLSVEQIRGMLKLRKAEIEQRLEEEQTRLARVAARLQQIEQESEPLPYDVVVRQVEPCMMATIRTLIPSLGNDISQMFEALEAYVAQHGARAVAPPLTILHDSEYREHDLDVEVAVPVNAPLPGNEQVTIRELPGVETMACVIHTGCYTSIDRAFNILLAWVEAHHYTIIGPIREVYLRFGAGQQDYALSPAYLANHASEFVTELQLPVEYS